MTSISEDQTLPLDLDGTSNQLSNSSSQYGGGGTGSLQDLSSSLSEMDPPGTFTNLTSAGRLSPHRTRTMKDQESQLAELKKENFGLKLRIYHLEEALRSKWGNDSEGWQLNIELQVQLDGTKKELAEKDALVMKAKQAIDSLKDEHRAQIRELQQRLAEAASQTEDLQEMRDRLAAKEEELAGVEEEAREAAQRAEELAALCAHQEEELKDKDGELDQLKREVEGLQGALADSAAKAPPPRAPGRNAYAQTSEPLTDKLAEAEAQLEAARGQLAGGEGEAARLRGELADRERRVKELEVELLTSSQNLAASAGDHAHQMREQEEQLNKCKARLRDADDEVRRRGAELEEMGRDLEGARQRAREAESLAQRLQPMVQQRDKEIQELRDQLADAEDEANDDIAGRDREIRELKRRLRDAESRASQAEPELAARAREVERLEERLREVEEEAARLRSRLREREEALAHARKATHTANMDKQEQADALEKLQRELQELREMLRRQQDGVQRDLEAALAAKDAIIEQLRRDLQDIQARLDDADEKLLQVTASKAAELGVLRANIEDLTRQLEHQDKLIRELRGAVGRLEGEGASLRQELDRRLAENQELRNKLAALKKELLAKNKALQQAEEALASLRKLLAELQQSQPSTEAQLAQLQSQLAAMEAALGASQGEAEGLRKAMAIKDSAIKELRQQVSRLLADKAALEEKLRQFEREKGRLEAEVAELQSQARIAQLAADDLQQKLTQAFTERQELARQLRLAEAALKDKRRAFDGIQSVCDGLKEQVKQLQQQVADLQSSAAHHVTATASAEPPEESATPPKQQQQQPPAGSSTTMIFGSLSESLLLQILRQMQELSKEISAGRAEGTMASSSLSAKMEHLAELQRHVEEVLRNSGGSSSSSKPQDGQPSSGNTNYTTYYFMRGEGEEEEEESEDTTDGEPRDSSTPKSKQPAPVKAKTSPGKDVHTALRDAMRQISALQAELEQMKRAGDREGRDTSTGPSLASSEQFMYRELEKEVDRLLAELEAERQRSQADKEQQQREFSALQAQLKEAEDKVDDLESQLREAMMRDAATSTEPEVLQQEIERLTNELDEALASMADLRAELNEARASALRETPKKVDKTTLASTSMPNLLTPETPYKSMSDSWTSPRKVSPGSDQPDVRALREKHEEVKRLNIELQRKCHEQLKRSPATSRPSSADRSSTTLHWPSRLSEQEQALRSEMLEKERSLLAQLHDCEARLVEKEAGWRAGEMDLRRQIAELESQLGVSSRSCDNLRSKLAEALANCRTKDEEIRNLTRSLAAAREKIKVLENQVEQLSSEKNARISELESSIHRLEQELLQTRSKAAGADLLDGSGASDLQTLQETVDSLTEQLTSALEELEELRNQNSVLEENRAVLTSQMASWQEQIRTLQSELGLYQKLLEERSKGEGEEAGSSGRPQLNLTADRVLQLLEEVRRLRDELDQSIRSNNAFSEQLQSRLRQRQRNASDVSESHLHYSTHTSPPPPPSEGTASQTDPKKYKHTSSYTVNTEQTSTHSGTQTDGKTRRKTSQGTSPHTTRMSDKSTGPHPPSTANKATGTTRTTRTVHTERSSYYRCDSGGSSPLSDSKPTDSASSSFTSQPPKAKAKQTSPMPFTATRITSISPENASTSRVHTTQHNGHDYTADSRHTRRAFSDSLHGERFSRTARVSRGINTDVQEKSRSDEVLSAAKGPTLDSSSSSFHSFSSHSRDNSQTRPAAGRGASFRPPVSLLGHGTEDFSALELKLKQALEAPGLQASDRSFLEELLVYLRQQRRQLDESQKLLERLEQQGDDFTDRGLSTAESGTNPAVPGLLRTSFTSTVIEDGDSFGHVGPTRLIGVPPSNEAMYTTSGSSTARVRQSKDAGVGTSRASHHSDATSQTNRRGVASKGTGVSNGGLGTSSHPGPARRMMGTQATGQTRGQGAKVNLSSLYEQLLQTQASLVEARSTLNQRRTQ